MMANETEIKPEEVSNKEIEGKAFHGQVQLVLAGPSFFGLTFIMVSE